MYKTIKKLAYMYIMYIFVWHKEIILKILKEP